MGNREFGFSGQDFAEKFLRGLGYRLIGKNYNTRFGEIDLIAKDGDYFVFVEVKTRRSERFGAPEEAVTKQKQRHLAAAAQIYLGEIRAPHAHWRIDVVALVGEEGNFSVRHLKDAVSF